jgi:hypothetical protein
MAKRPEPPPNPIRWDVYRAAARGKLLGTGATCAKIQKRHDG